MADHWTAQELLDLVLDAGSFESWDEPIDISDAPPDYRSALEAAREKAGTDESVLTGRGLVHGRPVAVLANEFRFLAGSIGLAAARRIASAVRRATAERLPVLATTASGGTRMQEGTPAFVQMVEISRALMEHRAAGLPYLAYLRHPTTGGVYASWGSLAHVTVAEPGALIGFLGPKVFEALNGTPFPEGVQVAENLSDHGVIDGVATAEELPGLVDAVLAILVDPPSEPRLPRRSGELDPDLDAWAAIQETRGEARIGVRDVLRAGTEVLLPLSGTEKGERDSTILVVMARLDGEPCLVVGQDRSRQGPATPMGPGALRTARRAHAARERDAVAAGHRDRHPGRGALTAGRGGCDRRRDRALPGEPRDDDRADGLGRARTGRWRRGAGAAAGPAGDLRREGLADAPATGRGQCDRAR